MTFQQKDFIGRNYFLIRNSDFNKFSDLPKANYEYLTRVCKNIIIVDDHKIQTSNNIGNFINKFSI